MQCGTDCSTAVEFNTAIMLVLLMGCRDFTGAGAVAVLVGKGEASLNAQFIREFITFIK
jgi:hypothetical protein